MRRKNAVPTLLVLLAAGFLVWPTISSAFQDSPIVVGDASSIHFKRTAAGQRFQTEPSGLFVHEANKTVRSITIAGNGNVALGPGWRIDMRDSDIVAHMFATDNMDTVHIDFHGHGVNLPAPFNEGVLANFHLTRIHLTPRGGAAVQNFTCPARADCFTIHYQ